MPTLHFSGKHAGLVSLLTEPLAPDLPSLFPRYRELLLFAAMVGKARNRVAERVGNGGEVDLSLIHI